MTKPGNIPVVQPEEIGAGNGQGVGNFYVCEHICDQCLFTDGKIVPNQRKSEVLEHCDTTDSHFVCHKATLRGQDVCCRGFYNRYGTRNLLIRLATMWGLVKFVRVWEPKHR